MYSPTPAPPQAPPTGRKSRGRRVAVVIWLVLFLVAAIATVVRIVDYQSQPEDQRVPAAGGTVTITQAGEYSVYGESDLRVAGNYPGLASVTSPSGAPVPVSASGMSETYHVNERGGSRIGTFAASETGTYTLVGVPQGTAPGDQLVVSTRTIGAVLAIVFGSVVTGILLIAGLVGGLVLWLVGRRRRTRDAADALVAQYGPGPYGAPPPGAAPYGQYGARYGTPPSGAPPYGAGPPPNGPGAPGFAPYGQAPQQPAGHPGHGPYGQAPPGPPPAGLGPQSAQPSPPAPPAQPSPSEDRTTVVRSPDGSGSEDATVVHRTPDHGTDHGAAEGGAEPRRPG